MAPALRELLPLIVAVRALPQVKLKSARNKMLTFEYTVQEGDSSSDLDYTSSTALSLNGGSCAVSRIGSN